MPETVYFRLYVSMRHIVPRRLRRGIGVALTAASLAWVQGPAVLAGSAPVPDFSLAVSPTRLVVPAGAHSTVQHFQVTNGGRSPFQVTVEKANFTAADNGALNFQPDAPYAAAAWVKVEPTHFRMAAGTTRNVTIQITKPARPEPGDHHVALIFKVPAGRNAANFRINRGIATPVFITVPGPTDASVEMAGLSAPGFALGGPVFVTAKIHDFGTVHHDFRGRERLRVEAGGTGAEFPDFTVLRGATRTVTARWEPPLMCVCDATVSVPGSRGTASTATVRIVVFPLHLLAMVIGALLTLLLLRWFVRRRFRARVLAAASALRMNEDADE